MSRGSDPKRPLTRRLLGLMLSLALGFWSAAPGRAETAPGPPDFRVLDLGPAFRGANARVLGLDGAFSVSLGQGRSLWIFGDTLLGSWQPNGDRTFTAMPPNTTAIVDDRDWVTGYSHAQFVGKPDPVALLTPTKPTYRPWPLDAVREGKTLRQFFVEIEPTGNNGPINFRVTGTGVASTTGLPGSPYGQNTVLWPAEAPSFGASVMRWQDAWYLYAGGMQTHLARATGPLDRPASYRYWAGDGRWVTDPMQAVPLPGSGPEVSVRYNSFLKAFVMIYVPPLGKTVEARFAPEPWGPWSEPTRLADCQPAGDPQAMFYGAKQHAELDVDGGREIVVSYNTNTEEKRLAQRPDLYWPRLLRVTFRAKI